MMSQLTVLVFADVFALEPQLLDLLLKIILSDHKFLESVNDDGQMRMVENTK